MPGHLGVLMVREHRWQPRPTRSYRPPLRRQKHPRASKGERARRNGSVDFCGAGDFWPAPREVPFAASPRRIGAVPELTCEVRAYILDVCAACP